MLTITFLTDKISLEQIASVYGILCLYTIPIFLVVLIIVFKKRQNQEDKKENKLKNLVAGLVHKKDKDNKEDNAPKEKASILTIEDYNEMKGVPNLVLRVGDKYKCFLTDKNRAEVTGSDHTWKTDNEFVGSIHQASGIFKAKKAGNVYVVCGADETHIYYIDIKANNENWFGFDAMLDVLSRNSINNIEAREIKNKIIALDNSKGILKYKTDLGEMSFNFDKSNYVKKCLFKIEDNGSNKKTIKDNIVDYFNPLKENKVDGEPFIWYHKAGSRDDLASRNSVDFIAFMCESKDKKLYFGISEFWRDGAAETEIMENIEMVFRSFSALLDEKEIFETIGKNRNDEPEIKEEPKTETEPATEQKKKTSAKKKSSSKKKKEETPAEESSKEGEKDQAQGNDDQEITSGDYETSGDIDNYEPNNEDGYNPFDGEEPEEGTIAENDN